MWFAFAQGAAHFIHSGAYRNVLIFSSEVTTHSLNPSEPERANAVAIQDDGKIVAAGEAFGRDWEFALARYLDS